MATVETILFLVFLFTLGVLIFKYLVLVLKYLDGDFEVLYREEYGQVKSWGKNYVIYKETMKSGRIRFKRYKL